MLTSNGRLHTRDVEVISEYSQKRLDCPEAFDEFGQNLESFRSGSAVREGLGNRKPIISIRIGPIRSLAARWVSTSLSGRRTKLGSVNCRQRSGSLLQLVRRSLTSA